MQRHGLALKRATSIGGNDVPPARAEGIDWEVAQTLDDEALEAWPYGAASR